MTAARDHLLIKEVKAPHRPRLPLVSSGSLRRSLGLDLKVMGQRAWDELMPALAEETDRTPVLLFRTSSNQGVTSLRRYVERVSTPWIVDLYDQSVAHFREAPTASAEYRVFRIINVAALARQPIGVRKSDFHKARKYGRRALRGGAGAFVLAQKMMRHYAKLGVQFDA